MTRLYLDYNAGAPLRPEARDAMLQALLAGGNASSVHREGRAAHERVEAARAAVAELAGADPKLVTFVSGGTEANNTVLTPDWTLAGKRVEIATLLIGATEHPSVLAGGRFAPEKVGTIPVDGQGTIRLDALRAMLAGGDGPALVSVMLANNETGAIQPIAEAAEIAHTAGALIHTDAIQAAGKIPLSIRDLGVDILTISAHKIGGPQGVGAIIRASDDIGTKPLLSGGGQERRSRAGTENVAAIAGFGVAARLAKRELDRAPLLADLRDKIAEIVRASGRPVTVFSEKTQRLPQTLCIAVHGVSAETLVIALDLAGVAASSGSACSSGKVAPSHVLEAMGVAPDLAKCAIRLSLGWDSAKSDLDLFSTAWNGVLKHVSPGTKAA